MSNFGIVDGYLLVRESVGCFGDVDWLFLLMTGRGRECREVTPRLRSAQER